MIDLLVLDVDGVLTNGEVLLDADGNEWKSLYFRDIDAVHRVRAAGVAVALLSGESTPLLAVIAGRLGVEHVTAGRKDKDSALREVAAQLQHPLEAVCYVGDADRDAPALRLAGLGIAPADASLAAREAAAHVLSAPGGRGAVEEAVALVLARRASG